MSSLACASLAFAALCFGTKTYTCDAPSGQTCTATNVDTGVVTTFQRGEKFIINGGTWRLSTNWNQG